MEFNSDYVVDLVKQARSVTKVHYRELETLAKAKGFAAVDFDKWLNTKYDIFSYRKNYDLTKALSKEDFTELEFLNYIPEEDPLFVPNGNYSDILTFLEAEEFIPMLLTGPTGLGKTKMIDQIHAKLRKPLVRVNITIESDEDSLMGGFRLREGSTYFDKGPVVRAMEMGATLLLDELDLASPGRILCLQSVLEGVGYLIKKTSEFVRPAPGFQVVATANTKGAGDESGVYIATNTLNGAMMDRFTLFFECEYPTESVETKILNRALEVFEFKMPQAEIELLVKWAAQIRSNKSSDLDLEYSISTRRLVDIIKVNKILNGNLDAAIDMCLKRFDGPHSQAFKDIYKALKPKKAGEKTSQAAEDIIFDEDNNLKF